MKSQIWTTVIVFLQLELGFGFHHPTLLYGDEKGEHNLVVNVEKIGSRDSSNPCLMRVLFQRKHHSDVYFTSFD